MIAWYHGTIVAWYHEVHGTTGPQDQGMVSPQPCPLEAQGRLLECSCGPEIPRPRSVWEADPQRKLMKFSTTKWRLTVHGASASPCSRGCCSKRGRGTLLIARLIIIPSNSRLLYHPTCSSIFKKGLVLAKMLIKIDGTAPFLSSFVQDENPINIGQNYKGAPLHEPDFGITI